MNSADACFSLTVFSRDYVPVLQTLIQGAGLISIIFLWIQIRESRLWSKRQAAHSFLDIEASLSREAAVIAACKSIGITLNPAGSLDDTAVQKIIQDGDAFAAVKKHLNDFETICCAYRLEHIDHQFTRSLYSHRFKTTLRIFRPLILELRRKYNDKTVFSDFLSVVSDWESYSG